MRILFLSHYFPPERNAPANRTFSHCRRWAARGHDVSVITCAPHHPTGTLYPGYRNALRRVDRVEGIRVVRCVTYLAANRGTWKRSLSYLTYLFAAVFCSLVEKRPDIVISTSPQFFCGWAGVLVSRLRRIPLLLEIRDLWPESIAAVGAVRRQLPLRVLETLERWMYRSAFHIVTVGDGYRRELIKREVHPAKVSVVMNGVDGDLFFPRPKDTALSDRFGLGRRFVITYCGAVGLAHGLDVVLRAGSILRERGRHDVVFLVIGDGARLARLRAEAARQRLRNVLFAGSMERHLIPQALAMSDVCLVHLRKSETFDAVMPSKIFEAAAIGRPIILGVGGFAREFVTNAGCGLLVEPENEHDLVQAAIELADDPELRERLGRAGPSYVADAFDRRRLADQYLRIIETVVRRQSVPVASDEPTA